MANDVTSGNQRLELGALYGRSASLARELLELIDSEPARAWMAEELIEAVDGSIADVLMILARLTVQGEVLHDGLRSGYRSVAGRKAERAG